MHTHPFIADLSSKSLDELSETINTLNKRMQFMYRTGKHDMVRQIQMAIASYRDEYVSRQQKMAESSEKNISAKIDIS